MSGEVIYKLAKQGFICKMLAVVFRSEKWSNPRDVACREGEAAEYVCNCLFPPFPRCERECRGVPGRSD